MDYFFINRHVFKKKTKICFEDDIYSMIKSVDSNCGAVAPVSVFSCGTAAQLGNNFHGFSYQK